MAIKIGTFKGAPTISLASETRFPFTFGRAKAQLILDNLDAIRSFVHGAAPSNGNNGSGGTRSHLIRFGDGAEMIQNVRGRCEDAPCCGCCS